MEKRCFLFEGQGTQHTGMGKQIYSMFPEAKEVFDIGSEVTKLDLKKLCFETEFDELSKTDKAQLAVFTVSMAVYNVLKAKDKIPDIFAGFSLGECSALCAAGVFALTDAFLIVKKRGELMHRCALNKKGAMYAIIGLEDSCTEEICSETKGYVIPVNYNCPYQLVIAGDDKSVGTAAQRCLEKGAKRAVRLAVEGAFHSRHMAKAASEFRQFLTMFKSVAPIGEVYSNIYGDRLTDFSHLNDYLAGHMLSPVRWKREIACIKNSHNDVIFYEIGCGNTLTQFNRRIDKNITTKNLSTTDSVLEVLG
ncbi:MAG: ACP S-malonyltransferase [Clostridiaceae bacterium]|nr:ACP S-malonyltransferase [Clostridiaceae bacterium]